MDMVVYLYDESGNIVTQLFDVTNFEVTQNLNSYDTASFQIPYDHVENLEALLHPFNECKINIVQSDNTEKTYIHWVIDSVEADLMKSVVYVRSFEWLFEHKIIDTDKNYSAWTVDAVMVNLLANVNGRYDTGLTLDCGVTDTIDLVVKKWSTLASAMSEIVKLWYQYRVINKVLLVKEIVGEDKTSWLSYTELNWDINNPKDRNISEAKIKLDWAQIINAPFHSTGGFSTDPTSITNFGRIEKTVTWDGTPAQVLSDTLAKHKDLVKVIDVTPVLYDFFLVDVWDVVQVNIDAGNDIMQYVWSVNVLQKTLDTRWVIRVQVSSSTIKSLSFLETVKKHERDIEKLQNA